MKRLFVLFLLLSTHSLFAQQFSQETMKKLLPDFQNSPSWIKESHMILDYQNSIYYLVNGENGVRKKLFSQDELLKMLSSLTLKGYDEADTKFYPTKFADAQCNKLIARVGGNDVIYDINKKQLSIYKEERKKNDNTTKRDYWKKYCADSTYFIYGKHHDVYLSAKNGDSVRLTKDGESYFSHVMHKNPLTDSTNRSYRGDWFNDTHIAYGLRCDLRKVTTMAILNSVEKIPTVKEYKFELAGDKFVTQYEINLIYADSQKVTKANISKFLDQEVKLVLNFNKDKPYDAIYFTRKSRTCDTLELCALNPIDSKVTVVASEVSYPKVNELLHNFAIINGGKEVVWWSERDGKGAYFLYDGAGNEKNRITNGEFVAGKIISIDTMKRSFIFEGYGYNKGENPQNRHYFKVNFDGTGFTNLTPEKGNHSINFSDNKLYYIDSYSTIEQPNRYELRNLHGKKITNFASRNLVPLTTLGWKAPKEEVVKAADGITDLYGVIYRPHTIDSTKKYPIICNVYPGPQTDQVPNSFSLDEEGLTEFAQLGFIIIQFGYRGSSPLRGKAFYNFSNGNLRDYALEDCKYVVEQLAAKYSYIDLDRVGIFGHSGGGFLSTTAILTYPDFFKVAVAVSGNHDNNIYAKFWGEVYNGVKREGDNFVSKIATNMELAPNLKGRLMLITGEVDDNVHPANTMRMVDALIKSNKRFDMLIMPRKDHGMGGDYYNNVIKNYFGDYLLNVKSFDANMK